MELRGITYNAVIKLKIPGKKVTLVITQIYNYGLALFKVVVMSCWIQEVLLELHLRELPTVCLSNYNLRKKEMFTSVVFISSDQPSHDLSFFLTLASFLVPKCNRNMCWSKTLKNKHRNVKFKFPMF